MSKFSELGILVTLDSTQLNSGLKKVDTQLKKTGSQAKKTGKELDTSFNKASKSSSSFLDTILKIYLAYKALEGLANVFLTPASAIEELNSALSYIGSQGGQEAIDTLNEIVDTELQIGAMSELMAKQTTKNFLAITSALGFTIEKSTEMTSVLTKLTRDFSSFNNLSLERSQGILQSLLVGETEPGRQFGIIITEALLQTEALAAGIIKTNRELTEQEKVLARMNIILRSTTNSQGDFVRTQEEFANTIRRSQSNIENLAITIGTNLIPLFKPLIQDVGDLAFALNDFLRTSEAVENGMSGLVQTFQLLGDVVKSISHFILQIADMLIDVINSFNQFEISIESVGTAWNALSIGIEFILDLLKLLVSAFFDSANYISSFASDVTKALTFQGVDFSATQRAFTEFNKRFQDNVKDLITMSSVDLKKQQKENEKKVKESSQITDIPLQEVDIKLKTTVTGTNEAKAAIKEIKVSMAELEYEAERVEAGSINASASFSKYTAKFAELKTIQVTASRELTQNEQKTLDILEETIPLSQENLKINQTQLEILETAEGMYKNIKDAIKEEIIANNEVVESIQAKVREQGKYFAYLKQSESAQEALLEFNSRIGDRDDLNTTEKQTQDILVSLAEQERIIESRNEKQREYLQYLEKQSQLQAEASFYLEASEKTAKGLFDTIASGVTGEGLTESLSSLASGIASFAGPLASSITNAITGVISGIIDLAMAVEVAKTEKLIAEMERNIVEAERAAEELKIEIEFIQKALDDLETANIIDNTKREAERARFEAELIKQGKTEEQIKQELRDFDKATHEIRLKQIEAEMQRQQDLIDKIRDETGINVVDEFGEIDQTKLEELRRQQEADAKRKNDLEALRKEIELLSNRAGKYVTGEEEKAAEALAERLKGLVGEDIFGDLFGTNFGQDDLDAMITRINVAMSTVGADFSDEVLDSLGGLADLDKELADSELEMIKSELEIIQQQKELQEGIIRENIERQEKYLEGLRDLYDKANNMGMGGLQREIVDAGTRTTQSSIGTQINYNIQSQTVGSI